MNALASLATTSLLGTERRPPQWPVHQGPLGALLAQLPPTPPEKTLLQTAGILGTCHLAGWQPPRVPASPAPSEADVRPHEPSSIFKEALAGVLIDGPVRLQAEAFQKLAKAGYVIPHRLLSRALDCGKRSTALRPSLLPTLGTRGAWLAAQNESWAYAVGGSTEAQDDPQIWEHGSLDQRRLYLTSLRQKDAAKARDLVAIAMATEAARERSAFIECLATGLSLDDQDLLEVALKDKSKETRQAAASLLSSRTDSRFVQRMIARLDPCLTLEKKFLRGTVITLEPPTAYAAEWKGDLIEETKPKSTQLGERAWWLFQIVKAVPLRWWETRTSLTPTELIAWAQKSDWKDALLQGWAGAQALQKRVEWAEAFLSTRIPPGSALDPIELLESLPLPQREEQFMRLFEHARQGQSASILLDRFLASLPFDSPPLSPATSRELVQVLKQYVNSGSARYDWQLRNSLIELACVLPAPLFAEAASGWDLTKVEVQPFAEAIARLSTVLDQRHQLQCLKPVS